MSSGSKGIPGVWRVIENWKGVETMMTELDEFKEFTICSVDKFREEVRMAETTSFCLSERKASTRLDLPVSETSSRLLPGRELQHRNTASY